MWHSDTISLALSRCCLHTHAPARLHVHTDVHARTHHVFPRLQQMFCSVHMCHRYSVCVHVYVSLIQKCFSAVQRQVQHEDTWLASHSQTHSVSKHTHTQNQKHIDRPSDQQCVFIFAGASITTISKPSLRGPLWETLSSKPCELKHLMLQCA